MAHDTLMVYLVEDLYFKSNGVVWATAADHIFSKGGCGQVDWSEASCTKPWRIILANVWQRLRSVDAKCHASVKYYYL